MTTPTEDRMREIAGEVVRTALGAMNDEWKRQWPGSDSKMILAGLSTLPPEPVQTEPKVCGKTASQARCEGFVCLHGFPAPADCTQLCDGNCRCCGRTYSECMASRASSPVAAEPRTATPPMVDPRVWQCSGCHFKFTMPWRAVCPCCHQCDYWSGAVSPDAVEWQPSLPEIPLVTYQLMGSKDGGYLDTFASPVTHVRQQNAAAIAYRAAYLREKANWEDEHRLYVDLLNSYEREKERADGLAIEEAKYRLGYGVAQISGHEAARQRDEAIAERDELQRRLDAALEALVLPPRKPAR